MATSRDGIFILGNGRLGRAWSAELGAIGRAPVAVWGRRPGPGATGWGGLDAAPLDEAGVVLVCVQDGAIPEAAGALAGRLSPGTVVLHGSGLRDASALDALRPAGAWVGSLHPLQSFPPEAAAGRMRGAVLAVEGDDPAVAVGFELAAAVGGQPRRLRADQKPAYHAAAVIASNLLVAVVDAATEAAGLAGFERSEALGMLLPLVSGSVANLRDVGLPHALTGPVARGDGQVVEAHLAALEGRPALRGIYIELSRRAVELARAQGRASQEALSHIATLLDAHGSPPRDGGGAG